MLRFKKFFLFTFFALIMVISPGCSVIPDGVKNLFASKTPTPTNTPTSTRTPTITPTPTKTPLPPIFAYPCQNLDACPEAIPLDEFLGYPASFDFTSEVEIPYDQVVNINMDWVVLDYQTLDETAPYIKWIFTIDGQDYMNEDWLFVQTIPDMNDPSITYPGMWLSVNLADWKPGEMHEIRIGLTLEKSMSDGWGDLPAGHTAIKKYIINPVELPTATATNTPKPTPIPQVSTPKPPAAPACDVNAIIPIENNTGGWITIKLKGPASFTFDLPAGNQNINVCSGHYTYTAWGCGGSSKSGEADANSTAITFFCQ